MGMCRDIHYLEVGILRPYRATVGQLRRAHRLQGMTFIAAQIEAVLENLATTSVLYGPEGGRGTARLHPLIMRQLKRMYPQKGEGRGRRQKYLCVCIYYTCGSHPILIVIDYTTHRPGHPSRRVHYEAYAGNDDVRGTSAPTAASNSVCRTRFGT